jgi:hypothetical protein
LSRSGRRLRCCSAIPGAAAVARGGDAEWCDGDPSTPCSASAAQRFLAEFDYISSIRGALRRGRSGQRCWPRSLGRGVRGPSAAIGRCCSFLEERWAAGAGGRRAVWPQNGVSALRWQAGRAGEGGSGLRRAGGWQGALAPRAPEVATEARKAGVPTGTRPTPSSPSSGSTTAAATNRRKAVPRHRTARQFF